MFPEIFSLANKVALVTGSGQGIGKAIALLFAGAGADVVVAEINPNTGRATAEEIRSLGRKSLHMATDVTDKEQIAALVKGAIEKFGHIDVLVNNAGRVFDAKTLEMSESDWDKIIQSNLKPVFLCSQAAGNLMREKGGGSIINISSVAGLHAHLPNPAYGAARAAVINFTKTMAVEFAPYNIRVNSIAPATIATHLDTRGPQYYEQRRSLIPLGRVGKPEDIAAAALYLASPAAAFVTGIVLPVDGGKSAQ